MTKEVFVTSPDASLSDAAQSMVKGRFGSAVIKQGAWVAGIFTERDLLRAVAAGVDPTTTKVSEWMTAEPVSATPDMDSEEAGQIMVTQGFRHLPVVEGGEVVGIVSLRDILGARIRPPEA